VDLVVRVRAAGDSSLASVFRPLLAASAAASRQVEANLAGAGKGAAKGAADAAKAHRAAGKEIESVYRANASAAEDWHKRADAAAAASHKRALANLRDLEREQRSSVARQAADERRRKQEVGSATARTFGGLARSGVGVLGRAASEGFGVDLDVFSAMGRARETRDLAGRATRSAATAQGKIATAADIEATVKAIQEGGDKSKLA